MPPVAETTSDEVTLNRSERRKSRGPLVCQVQGCERELENEKKFFQRHRICAYHLKLDSLVVDGKTSRFCQQCGRFHGLEEFEGLRRSCTKQLTLHNKRRNQKRKEAPSHATDRQQVRTIAEAEAAAAAYATPLSGLQVQCLPAGFNSTRLGTLQATAVSGARPLGGELSSGSTMLSYEDLKRLLEAASLLQLPSATKDASQANASGPGVAPEGNVVLDTSRLLANYGLSSGLKSSIMQLGLSTGDAQGDATRAQGHTPILLCLANSAEEHASVLAELQHLGPQVPGPPGRQGDASISNTSGPEADGESPAKRQKTECTDGFLGSQDALGTPAEQNGSQSTEQGTKPMKDLFATPGGLYNGIRLPLDLSAIPVSCASGLSGSTQMQVSMLGSIPGLSLGDGTVPLRVIDSQAGDLGVLPLYQYDRDSHSFIPVMPVTLGSTSAMRTSDLPDPISPHQKDGIAADPGPSGSDATVGAGAYLPLILNTGSIAAALQQAGLSSDIAHSILPAIGGEGHCAPQDHLVPSAERLGGSVPAGETGSQVPSVTNIDDIRQLVGASLGVGMSGRTADAWQVQGTDSETTSAGAVGAERSGTPGVAPGAYSPVQKGEDIPNKWVGRDIKVEVGSEAAELGATSSPSVLPVSLEEGDHGGPLEAGKTLSGASKEGALESMGIAGDSGPCLQPLECLTPVEGAGDGEAPEVLCAQDPPGGNITVQADALGTASCGSHSMSAGMLPLSLSRLPSEGTGSEEPSQPAGPMASGVAHEPVWPTWSSGSHEDHRLMVLVLLARSWFRAREGLSEGSGPEHPAVHDVVQQLMSVDWGLDFMAVGEELRLMQEWQTLRSALSRIISRVEHMDGGR